MKQVLFMSITILFILHTPCQTNGQARVVGQVYDSSMAAFLSKASIVCVKVGGTQGKKLTSTDKDGWFRLDSIFPGSYLINIAFLGYETSSRQVDIDSGIQVVDLGITNLRRIGLDLKAIEIVGNRSQLKVKRDTLEYSAGNFKTRPNATIEDLLRKLPGVEVGDDGSITINGETAKQIMINGRQFFVDDPKLVSRYILSEMVDKIQLIDRKGSQIRGGEINAPKTEKVINVIIKKEKRNEITGHMSSSFGTNDKFASKANLSRFNEKQQIGAFATGDNINGYQDGKMESSEGIVRSWKGGISYSDDLSRKVTIGGSYLIDNSKTEVQRRSIQQNLLLDSNYYSQQTNSTNYLTNQIVNFKLDYRIDSLQTLSVTNAVSYQYSVSSRDDSFDMVDKQTKAKNFGTIEDSKNNTGYNVMTGILFDRRFKKEGRLLSVNLAYGLNRQKGVNYDLSTSEYQQYSREAKKDTINQKKEFLNKNEFIQIALSYVEPLGKAYYLTFTHAFTRYNTPSDLYVYGYDQHTGTYSHFNDTLSSRFLTKLRCHYTGLGISTSQKRYSYNISLFANIIDLRNQNIKNIPNVELRDVVIVPNTSFSYYFDSGKQLNFSYLATIQMPDITQLQPSLDNSNPMYLQKGNEALRPAQIHTVSIGYNFIDTKSLRNLSIVLSGEFVKSKIINGTSIDTLGRQISQAINRNGAYVLTAGVNNDYPLGKGSSVKLATAMGFSRDVNYLNGMDGHSRNISGMQSVSLRSSYKDKLDVNVSTSISYNSLKYFANENNNSNFISYKFSLDCSANIPFGIVVGGNVRYVLGAGRAVGYNLNMLLMNAYMSKSLLNTKRLVIKIQGFDLLNRNTNNARTIGDSYVIDTYSVGLQRLFLFNLTYYVKGKGNSGK